MTNEEFMSITYPLEIVIGENPNPDNIFALFDAISRRLRDSISDAIASALSGDSNGLEYELLGLSIPEWGFFKVYPVEAIHMGLNEICEPHEWVDAFDALHKTDRELWSGNSSGHFPRSFIATWITEQFTHELVHADPPCQSCGLPSWPVTFRHPQKGGPPRLCDRLCPDCEGDHRREKVRLRVERHRKKGRKPAKKRTKTQ